MRKGRTSTFLVAAAASTIFVVVAVLFANVSTAARVAENSARLHHTNAILGTAALARAAAGQVAVFEGLETDGLTAPGAVDTARSELSETRRALADLAVVAAPEIRPSLDTLLTDLAATPMSADAVDASYRATAEVLQDRITALETDIDESQRQAGYVLAGIRLLVTLLLPVTAILLYRRRAVAQVRAAEVKLEAELEAERQIARAKDQFVAGMSHEIRTPLTGIYGFSEVLLESPEDAAADREIVTIIHNESSDLSRMVDDFIAVSRFDGIGIEIEASRFDLTALVRSVTARFRHKGAHIAVTGDSVLALADSGRTTQILTNLLANAVRHGGPGIVVICSEGETGVRCRIVDDGEGVPDHLVDRLFTRFVHQGAEVLTTGSLGLGTWVARELARAMGGDVVYARRGAMSVFELTLPAAAIETTEDATVTPVEAAVVLA